MKSRTIVLSKESLENMPKTTHEFKVIKHRISSGQHFKVKEGPVKNKNFIVDDEGYIKATNT